MATVLAPIAVVLDGALAVLAGRRCAGCGEPAADALCGSCLEELSASEPADHAAFRDAGIAARVVRRAKRGDWRSGGMLLAALVVRDRPWLIPPCDVVTWVPADGRRRAARGGHLPERFARALARALGVPCVQLLEPAAPRRTPQRGLDRQQRRRNAVGAFRIRRGCAHGARVALGVRVLVVDDVRTTGATLAACRDALARHGFDASVLAVVGVESRRAGRRARPESSLRAREIGSRIEPPVPIPEAHRPAKGTLL